MAGIDRDFWLEKAKAGISDSISLREAAAEKLDSFLQWLWVIYGSVFTLTSLFDQLSGELGRMIAVAQPLIVIMVARYFCSRVSMPTESDEAKADPAIVEEIIDSFIFIVHDKRRKLKNAQIATLVSILSLCTAIIGYNQLDPYNQLKKETRLLTLEKQKREMLYVPPTLIQLKTDSLKVATERHKAIVENILSTRKLECIQTHTADCTVQLSDSKK